jgi:hypothetical protein
MSGESRSRATLSRATLPPLPGVDPVEAPSIDDPGYDEWYQRVAVSPEGVDRMQIWESLHRTPSERLQILEDTVNEILRLRGGEWPEVR